MDGHWGGEAFSSALCEKEKNKAKPKIQSSFRREIEKRSANSIRITGLDSRDKS